MTCFLTSSPMIPELEEPVLNPANGFAQRLRDSLPVLADGKNSVWIVGYRISERYTVTEKTKRIAEVTFRPEEA